MLAILPGKPLMTQHAKTDLHLFLPFLHLLAEPIVKSFGIDRGFAIYNNNNHVVNQ
jgi:hypothetical protein